MTDEEHRTIPRYPCRPDAREPGSASEPLRATGRRIFYNDEGPIDTLLQIAARPVEDGDLVSKAARDAFVQLDWVARAHGWNIVTPAGRKAIAALALRRP